MSVFTTVTSEQLSAWLKNYALGELLDLEGIATGIENTNYSVTTGRGRYVLTLFEKLKPAELPFYLNLMAHLAERAIPCPHPVANKHNNFLGELNGKPASLVTFLPGKSLEIVGAQHCAMVGRLMAHMHLAGASYPAHVGNPRGAQWLQAALGLVVPFLDADTAALLAREVEAYARERFADIPRGVIHADLFRDNVLWDGERVGGVIDFYFACSDALLYDVAIAVNDWCLQPDGTLDGVRSAVLLHEYHKMRPFTVHERSAWPMMLRAGAVRFWMSRLHDLYLPRAGELTYAKDPRHFQRILEQHIAHEQELGRSLPQ